SEIMVMRIPCERHAGDGRGRVNHSGKFNSKFSSTMHGNPEIERIANSAEILDATWTFPVMDIRQNNINGSHTNGGAKIIKLIRVHVGSNRYTNLFAYCSIAFQSPGRILKIFDVKCFQSSANLNGCCNRPHTVRVDAQPEVLSHSITAQFKNTCFVVRFHNACFELHRLYSEILMELLAQVRHIFRILVVPTAGTIVTPEQICNEWNTITHASSQQVA